MEFSVTAPAETALKKLAKADIAVYKLKKRSSTLYFSVREEYVKKVFAIFARPCYNTVIRRKSAKTRFKAFLALRFGLLAGAIAFLAVILCANSFVFKIKVTGSGSYLAPQVKQVARECGASEWSFCRSLDAPLMQAKILAMPNVTFCSVKRDGSYLLIDVRAEEEHAITADYNALVSTTDGEIVRIVAICGTAEKAVGDKVAQGDVLIGAYSSDAEGNSRPCLAVGFAEIKRRAQIAVFYDSESEENAKSALAAPSLYAENVTEKSYKVRACEGGVVYDVDFAYTVTVSANME